MEVSWHSFAKEDKDGFFDWVANGHDILGLEGDTSVDHLAKSEVITGTYYITLLDKMNVAIIEKHRPWLAKNGIITMPGRTEEIIAEESRILTTWMLLKLVG